MITLKRSSLKIVSIITHNENVNEVQLANHETNEPLFNKQNYRNSQWNRLANLFECLSLRCIWLIPWQYSTNIKERAERGWEG